MAIYHFNATIISRAQGRSAVACAAYRAAEKLHDEKYNKDHDYTHKQDVASAEILLPDSAPQWMSNREKLWNAVELNEKRKDAQLAREVKFSLPKELTLEQNIELARNFVTETFVKEGMIADLSIHNDKQPDGQRQPHAHVMLTLREVNQSGFGLKVRAWNDKALLMTWREQWAELANHHLALNGHDLRIDHRTLAEQGIELEPQHKIGAVVAQDRLARLEDHKRIARENGEKILADPTIALHAITRQQSTFTHQDLARFVNRHSVDKEQFTAVYETVKSHESMVRLGLDDKNRERFTTREMLELESKMMTQAIGLSRWNAHAVSGVNQTQALSHKTLTSEQKIAFEHVLGKGDLKCVIGLAGTGKSYLLDSARAAWEAEGFKVHGVTLSGIAAKNLEGSSGIASRTFASRCHYWDKGEQRLTHKDIVVVDEAGMLSSRQMARVMEEAHHGCAKVVLVGDPQQLQAIEAGAAFRAIAEQVHYVELTDIRRQHEPWQQQATKELATGKTNEAILRYAAYSHVHDFDTKESANTALIEMWNDARLNEPHKSHIMLAYERKDVLELNHMARNLRQQLQELGPDTPFQTERGIREFAEHDRIYFLKNEPSLGVMNGTLGTIERIKNNALTIRLDDVDKPRTINITMQHYNQLDYGYAATIHKAQGVTVDRSYVLASKYLDAHATYVAMSRHRDSVDLFYGRDTFLTQADLINTLQRERPKDVTLDYLNTRDSMTTLGTSPRELIKPKDPHQLKQSYLSLMEFKRQFEEKNPERARELRHAILPRHERKALTLLDEFKQLEKTIGQGGNEGIKAQEQLTKLADDMSRHKEVMNYVHQHEPSLEKQVKVLAKEFQRDRDVDLER